MTPLANSQSGSSANRPDPSDENKGVIFVDDDGLVSISNGSVWIELGKEGVPAGGGGGSFGGVLTFSDLVPTTQAGSGLQNVKNGGGDYQLQIVNPLDVDVRLTGTIAITGLFISAGSFTGVMHYRQQFNIQGGTIQPGSALAVAGSMQSGETGPPPPVAQLFLPEIARPFGLDLAAGDTATLNMLHLLELEDGGVNDTYNISFNGQPRIVYSGVPLA